jgi:16S rRNA (guanine527-N7)-methyltransferase
VTPDDGVPRETPPVPAVARGVFADRLGVAVAFAGMLTTDGVTRGLIGPREAHRVWERHLVNCGLAADLLTEGVDVCDVGSGAGLPGLVLAVRRPDLRVTLVEPLLRRTTFLQEAVDRLGLRNVEVTRARAEELHGIRAFSVVTSRALAPLPRLLDWCMPLVREGGQLMAMKGASAAQELDAARNDLARWGAARAEVLTVGAEVIDPPTTVIRAVATRSSPLGWEPEGRGRIAAGGGRRSQRKGRHR